MTLKRSIAAAYQLKIEAHQSSQFIKNNQLINYCN